MPAGEGITGAARLASVPMGNTRPLPRQSAQPGQPGPPGQRPRPSRGRRYLKRAAIGLAAVIVVLAIAAGALWVATPSASQATALAEAQARQHGITYPGPVVPENFARPLVATEDHRFYSEPEVVLAVKLNLTYSKQQILDLYAEVAYYGHGFYGLEQASCGYFGRPASDLTVVQGAMLAGVVNAPSVDDPINDPVNGRARLEHVIARMVAVGYLTSAQGQQALRTPLGLTAGDNPSC
jgi:hypothetical protein